MEEMNVHPARLLKIKASPAKWKLLVVDDEVGMGESLRLLLGKQGYEVWTACSGAAALQEMRSRPFDLVITDLVMDQVNGYDILDFVNRERLNIPVVVLTGLGSVDAAVKALKHGAYDYIVKPFELDNFNVSIRRALEKRQLELIQQFQNTRLNAVASIAKAVTSTLKLDEIFQIITNQSREFVEFDNAALLLVNEEGLFADLFAIIVNGKLIPEGRERISREHPLLRELLSQRGSVIVPDVSYYELDGNDLTLTEGIRSFVLTPLITKDRLVGALFFGSRHVSAYEQEDTEFLIPIADQIAVAVDNARLLELELRRSRQLEIINHIGKQLTSSLVVDKLLESAICLLRDHFQYKYIDIYCIDPDKTSLVRTQYLEDEAVSALKPAILRVQEGIVGRVASTGQTVLLDDVQADPGYLSCFEDTSVELAVPLKAEGEIFGVLNIEDTASHKFSDDDRIVIEAVASQISLAWKNAKLFEQIGKSKIYLELVLNAAEDTSIISVDKDARIITFNSGSERLLGLSVAEAIGREISEVIQNKRTRAIFKFLTTRTKRESWEGEVRISRPDKKTFWGNVIIRPIEPAADLFVGFLIILTDVTPRVRLENKLKQLTVTDDLTGLYNQRHFSEQLRREVERASRRNSRLSLCIFDLDKFKQFNDTSGHLAGDKILKSVGDIVSRAIRTKIDTAFRYGGDEFVLLLPDTGLQQAGALVERLRRAIQQKFEDQITISAGIAEYSLGMAEKQFVEIADQLMYAAKRRGGDKVITGVAKRVSQT